MKEDKRRAHEKLHGRSEGVANLSVAERKEMINEIRNGSRATTAQTFFEDFVTAMNTPDMQHPTKLQEGVNRSKYYALGHY
jgi:hypothetical protein